MKVRFLGPLVGPAVAVMGIASSLLTPPAIAQALLSSGSGSIEFVATVKSNSISFLRPQTVLRGASGDGAERFEAKVSGSDLIVIRDARPCLRLSARVQNALKPGAPQKIALRWSGASAAVSVGSGVEEPLEPSLADMFSVFSPLAPAIGSRDIEAHGLALNQMPRLPEVSTDRRFVEGSKCFNPASVAKRPVQESYRGINLRGFSDQAQMDQARRWIGETPPPMLAVVKSVSVSSEGSQTWRGLAVPGSPGAVLLRPEALSNPNVFFHEGTHLLDGSRDWRDSKDWGVQFMGLSQESRSFSSGAVGHMDASAPGEQLAAFVGRAHEESLGFAQARICANDSACTEKMNFLAARGYISQADAKILSTQQSILAASNPMAPVTREKLIARAPSANPYNKTVAIVPPSGASSIDIAIEPRFFRPIDIYRDGGLTVNPTWRGCKAEDVMNRLSRRRPSAITSEPPLHKGVSRSYGYFDFGTKKTRRHYFALDEMMDGRIEMLFDMNGNGRLDDDGPARPNMGTFKDGGKGYATLLEIPWAEVMDNPPWSGNFKLWFMSNPFEWAIAGFSKSSRTQLIGSLELSGQKFDIIVADSAHSDNDGDLSNDGICLRKIGQKAVCYQDSEARNGVLIDGRQYAFNVRYR
jgi:hypothetical protein